MGEVYEVLDGNTEIDRFEVRDLRVKTRFAIDNQFYDEYTPILGAVCSMVYIALVRHANKEQKTWPSQSRIGAHVGISRQWVGRYLQILQFMNLIRAVRIGKMCTNRYYLIDEKYWRRDYDVMLKETETLIKEFDKRKKKGMNKVMLPQVTSPQGNIRWLHRLHHLLSQATSNSKDNHSKDKKEKTKIKIQKKTAIKFEKGETTRITIGKGTRVRTYFDKEKNTLVEHRY